MYVFCLKNLALISIHALRMEGDGIHLFNSFNNGYFYPRPPHGGRQVGADSDGLMVQFLSTPSAWRATQAHTKGGVVLIISIHALRMEGDLFVFLVKNDCDNFYPRPPHGGRPDGKSVWITYQYFYPRPPHGGRLDGVSIHFLQKDFYPRPPHGGRQQTC